MAYYNHKSSNSLNTNDKIEIYYQMRCTGHLFTMVQLLTNTICLETTLLCYDPCNNSTDEPLNVTLEQCANDIPYCCVSNGKCIMKNNPTSK